MRFCPTILCFALLPALSYAQDHATDSNDAKQSQVQAATTDATNNLRRQVLQTSLGGDVRIVDFLSHQKDLDDLTRVLKDAQPVGGTRWVNDQTCQVRLEIPASKIESLLTQIAADPDRHASLSSDDLRQRLARWRRMKFCGSGSSAGGEVIEQARPREALGKWSAVSEAARKGAIDQARTNAAHQVLQTIGPINLAGDTKASDVIAHPAVADQLNAWLVRQPVTRVDFLDDLTVQVTLTVSPRTLAGALKSAVESDKSDAPSAPVDWNHVTSGLSALPASVQGSASAAPSSATTLPSTVLPLQPPDWVDQQLQAKASARGNGSRLQLCRTAESRAVEDIKSQLLALHLDARTTLGDAAKSDPQLDRAIDQSLQQARIHRADYQADGTVEVHVSLDLQTAWDELRTR